MPMNIHFTSYSAKMIANSNSILGFYLLYLLCQGYVDPLVCLDLRFIIDILSRPPPRLGSNNLRSDAQRTSLRKPT
jgi:hypothetical protein